MFDYLYQWIQNIAYYLILMTGIIQVIPNKQYEKYIRFYMGLVIVLMLSTPLINIMGMAARVESTYKANTYRMEFEQLIKESEILKEVDVSEYAYENLTKDRGWE